MKGTEKEKEQKRKGHDRKGQDRKGQGQDQGQDTVLAKKMGNSFHKTYSCVATNIWFADDQGPRPYPQNGERLHDAQVYVVLDST